MAAAKARSFAERSGLMRGTRQSVRHEPHVPGLGTTLLRLVRVLVIGVFLARFRPLARVLALVTPSARRFRSGARPAHLLEPDRLSFTGCSRDFVEIRPYRLGREFT